MRNLRDLARAARRRARPRFESLEPRGLLAVTVPGLTATEGLPFAGPVATFAAGDVVGTGYQAQISWGDGHTTAGTVADVGGTLTVSGANTYRAPGAFPVTVTVTGNPGSSARGSGTADVAATTPVAVPSAVMATVGQRFAGTVATFSDPYPGLTADAYTASIAWGDGAVTAGAVVPDPAGGYAAAGDHVYASAGPQSVVVSVARTLDGQKATVTTAATVVSPSVAAGALTGFLDPATDTGAYDGVTAVNRPTFQGTAPAYAIVTVYVRRADQAQFTALGQTIAGPGGDWHLPAGGALPDGVYDVGASLTPAANPPGPLVALTPGGRLVVDTAPPFAASAKFDRATATVVVTLRDLLSGVGPSGLLDPTSYALTVRGRFRAYPRSVTVVPTAQVVPADAAAVALHFDGPGAAWASRPGAAVELGLLTDLAGNPYASRHVNITPSNRAFPAGPRARARRL